MAAVIEPLSWTAYCEDCDWESREYGYPRGPEKEAEAHNKEHHPND